MLWSDAGCGCRFEDEPSTPERPGVCDVDGSDHGPESFEEIMQWASKQLTSSLAMLSGQGVMPSAVLQDLSQKTFVITTSYSGIGVPEVALQFLQDAVSQHGGSMQFSVHAATDASPLCRRVLANHHRATRSEHLFSNLLERMPRGTLEALQGMQAKYMDKFKSEISAGKGKCSSKTKTIAVTKFGRAFVAEALKWLEQHVQSRDVMCYCYAHERMCPVWPTEGNNTLHVEVGGNTCAPWSSSGKHFGWLDPESIPCVAWIHSLRLSAPSIVVNECTPFFDVEVLERVFAKTHHFATIVFGPAAMGIPINRDRRYTVLVRKDRCQELKLLAETDFKQLVSAPLVAPASLFLRAPAGAIKQLLDQMGLSRGLPPAEEGDGSRKASVLLSPWHRQQLEKYQKLLETLPRFSSKKSVFIDLSQDPEERPRVHEMIPCLLKNTFLWSMEAKRQLHPMELLAVQCLPVFLPADNHYARMCPWSTEFLQSLSRPQIQQLAGNSMVVPAVGSVLLCALLSTVGPQ